MQVTFNQSNPFQLGDEDSYAVNTSAYVPPETAVADPFAASVAAVPAIVPAVPANGAPGAPGAAPVPAAAPLQFAGARLGGGWACRIDVHAARDDK